MRHLALAILLTATLATPLAALAQKVKLSTSAGTFLIT